MNAFVGALGEVANSLEIHSEFAFSLFGERHEAPASAAPAAPDSVLVPDACAMLVDALYSALHCREPRNAPGPDASFSDWKGAEEFVQRLSDANCGAGSWQSGWVIRGLDPDGQIVVRNHGLNFWASASMVRAGGERAEVGGAASVRVPKECLHLLPNFYVANGDAGHDTTAFASVRVYWNIHSDGAAALIGHLTKALNSARVPFLCKTLSDPLRFARTDAAVLYLSRDSYQAAAPLLESIHARLREYMRMPTSAYVKRLANGLGLAEDTGDGSSFGEHRSRLVAATFARRDVALALAADERVRAAIAALRRDRFDPAALYLNPGSCDDFVPFEEREANDV